MRVLFNITEQRRLEFGLLVLSCLSTTSMEPGTTYLLALAVAGRRVMALAGYPSLKDSWMSCCDPTASRWGIARKLVVGVLVGVHHHFGVVRFVLAVGRNSINCMLRRVGVWGVSWF